MLLALGEARGIRLDRTRFQKVIFKAELDRRSVPSTPSYEFFRWDHGPFSKQAANDMHALADRGLLRLTADECPRLDARGRELAEFLTQELARERDWRAATSALDDALGLLGRMSASEAKRWSHDLVVDPDGAPGQPVRVHDMTLALDIVTPRLQPEWKPLPVPNKIMEVFTYACRVSERDISRMRTRSDATFAELFG